MAKIILNRSRINVSKLIYFTNDFSETDNPFRPEGELAKEADEFVQQLKEKAEQEVNQIINIKSASNISEAAQVSTPVAAEPEPVKSDSSAAETTAAPEVAPAVEAEAKPSEVPVDEAKATTKKPKTKSKCGCSIS